VSKLYYLINLLVQYARVICIQLTNVQTVTQSLKLTHMYDKTLSFDLNIFGITAYNTGVNVD